MSETIMTDGACCDIYYGFIEHLCEKEGWVSSDRYCEVHHITPKNEGGSDEPHNLVRCSYEDHRLAHYYLAIVRPTTSNIWASQFGGHKISAAQRKKMMEQARTRSYEVNKANGTGVFSDEVRRRGHEIRAKNGQWARIQAMGTKAAHTPESIAKAHKTRLEKGLYAKQLPAMLAAAHAPDVIERAYKTKVKNGSFAKFQDKGHDARRSEASKAARKFQLIFHKRNRLGNGKMTGPVIRSWAAPVGLDYVGLALALEKEFGEKILPSELSAVVRGQVLSTKGLTCSIEFPAAAQSA